LLVVGFHYLKVVKTFYSSENIHVDPFFLF